MKKRNVDLSGIGQIKAKAVKKIEPEEPIVKQKIEKRFKENNKKTEKIIPIKKEKLLREKRTTNKRNESNNTAFLKNLTESLIPEIKNEYNLSSFSVYYAAEENFLHKIYGDELEGDIVIERCLSYTNPVVLINPNGITDNRVYKSRYIIKINIDYGIYLICASSFSIEAFRNNAGERITQKINEVLYPFDKF